MTNASSNQALLVSLMLVGIISVPVVLSALAGNVVILNSGMIAITLPLHVEGRYIKDSVNNTVTLRGVNTGGGADAPCGGWSGVSFQTYSDWRNNQGAVTSALDAIKSWGGNCVRFMQAAEYWVYNNNSHIQMCIDLANLLGNRSMYLIFEGGWSVRGYGNGAVQDDLPYPPYQSSRNAVEVIPNKQAFINMMVNICQTFASHPNVIIGLWNEPYGSLNLNYSAFLQARADWMNVTQQVITTARNAGVNNIILAQWQGGLWCNLLPGGPPPTPPQSPIYYTASVLDWIYDCPLNGSNIVYQTHCYQGAGTGRYAYNDILAALTYEWVYYVTYNMSKPLWFGEIGSTTSSIDLIGFAHVLQVLNNWTIGYCGWEFRTGTVTSLITSNNPSYDPSTAGQILKNAIAGIVPPPVCTLSIDTNINPVLYTLGGTTLEGTIPVMSYASPTSSPLFSGNYTVSMPSSKIIYTHHVLFGNTTAAGTGESGYTGYTYVDGPYSLSQSTTVTSVDLYCSKAGKAKVALYGQSGGYPSNLLVSSSEQTCTVGWNAFSISSTNLAAGNYYIAVKIDTHGMLAGVFREGSGIFQTTPYANAFSNPFGTVEGPISQEYAVYIPTAPFTTTTYNFVQWSDGNISPTRTINLTANMTLNATYG